MDLNPQEQSVVRRLGESKTSAISILMRSSIYCAALAGLFLYLALARNEPRYAIGIFGMFVLYLAIRVFTARRVAGIMPRILQRYEFRIAELEARLRQTEGDKAPPTNERSTS
jgi:hypothetical protein